MHQPTDFEIIVTDWQSQQQAISDIRRQVFIDEQNVPESMEWDEYEPCSWHVLARNNDTAIATGRLQPDGKITRIAVIKSWRRRGVASKVVEKLLQIATHNNVDDLYLHAQTDAVALYRPFGFQTQGEPFDEAGIEHIRMLKRVTKSVSQ